MYRYWTTFFLLFLVLACSAWAGDVTLSVAPTAAETGALDTVAHGADDIRSVLHLVLTAIAGFILNHLRRVLNGYAKVADEKAKAVGIETGEAFQAALDKVAVRTASEVDQWFKEQLSRGKVGAGVDAMQVKLDHFKATVKANPLVKELPEGELESLARRGVAFLKAAAEKRISAKVAELLPGQPPHELEPARVAISEIKQQ